MVEADEDGDIEGGNRMEIDRKRCRDLVPRFSPSESLDRLPPRSLSDPRFLFFSFSSLVSLLPPLLPLSFLGDSTSLSVSLPLVSSRSSPFASPPCTSYRWTTCVPRSYSKLSSLQSSLLQFPPSLSLL